MILRTLRALLQKAAASVTATNPAIGRSRRFLVLEPLEARVLMSISSRLADYSEVVVHPDSSSGEMLEASYSDGLTFLFINSSHTPGGQSVGYPVFIYTDGATDCQVVIHDSCITYGSPACDITVFAVDGESQTIYVPDNENGSKITLWVDPEDTIVDPNEAATSVHTVASYVGGTAKTVGAHLADPSDIGSTYNAQSLGLPLWTELWNFTSGPSSANVHQGSWGDCYLMCGLSALADHPTYRQDLMNTIVDAGDGTYVVEGHWYDEFSWPFGSGDLHPVYVKVSADLPLGGALPFLGATAETLVNSTSPVWAAVWEKAFCALKDGPDYAQNTYSHIGAGGNPYADDYILIGTHFIGSTPSYSIYKSTFVGLVGSGHAITWGTAPYSEQQPLTTAGLPLISEHCYQVVGLTGDTLVMRNPWGWDPSEVVSNTGLIEISLNDLFNITSGYFSYL